MSEYHFSTNNLILNTKIKNIHQMYFTSIIITKLDKVEIKLKILSLTFMFFSRSWSMEIKKKIKKNWIRIYYY